MLHELAASVSIPSSIFQKGGYLEPEADCFLNIVAASDVGLPVQAVYHMPTLETDEPERSLPLALQSLFFKVGGR